MHHHLPLRNKLIIMLSVMASLFLVALDQTIISTALGTIVEEFHSYSALSWIVTAYLLTTTITVPIAGKLSDMYGRKLLLLIGVAIFGAASLMSGMAGSVEQLILWRAIQGIGGGIVTANAFTIIGDLFAARERGRWQGLFGAVFGLSSVIGPLLGGWLTEGNGLFGVTTDWRWTFYINVPIAIAAFVLLVVFCPALRHAKKSTVDYVGAALLAVALGLLVLSVDNTDKIFASVIEATGVSLGVLRAMMIVVVATAVAGFVWVESRARDPIIPLSFFKNRNFVLIICIAALFGSSFMRSILYLTQFNQQVFGASPTESGLMLLPMIGGLMATSIISGQIISRTGRYKRFMQGGIFTATVMVFALSTLTPESSYTYEAVLILLLGAGLGVVMPVISLAVQNEFSQRELGVATSSSQLFRSLGSTVGVAIFGAILTAGLAGGLDMADHTAYVDRVSKTSFVQQMGDISNPDTLLNLNMPDAKSQVTEEFVRHLEASDMSEREQARVKSEFREEQREFAHQVTHAFSDSLRRIFVIAAVLMAVASILVCLLRERPLKPASPDDTPGA